MKALSIKQPWASLIAHGIKNIENRTWKTNFRGRIYIHVSAKMSEVDFTTEQTSELIKSGLYIPDKGFDKKKFEVSAIIGEVDIIDCVINHPSIWAEKTAGVLVGNRFYIDKSLKKPIYNWVLANPILYDKPILNVKGKLSFWEWEGCERGEIEA